MWRVEYNLVCGEMRDWLGAGDSQSWDDEVLGLCYTQCMLYLGYAVLGVNSGSLKERSKGMT